MKKILILGAGLVSRPGVTYLLNQKDLEITVASRTVSKALALVEGFPNGRAEAVNVENRDELARLIQAHDIAISLLPWTHHMKVAELCLEIGRHLVTTSYVQEAMRKLAPEVEKKGLLFLNEMGVDPGIDHMSAMKIIHEVYADGGKVLSFSSYCGGLPAPEDNDNPFGYKFSWSPRGVVLASRNSSRYLQNGKIVEIEGKNLFVNPKSEEIEGVGKLEIYPNRDSTPYKELYGLKDAHSVVRGTYRYPGWCATLKKIVDLGLVNEAPVEGLKGKTFREMMAGLVGAKTNEDVKAKTARQVGLKPDDPVIAALEWLGLFSNETVSDAPGYLDVLCDRMLEKLVYKPGEKDMLVLKHTFLVERRNGKKEKITSTMVDFGIPNGDSSMARTVSLPMAIGTRMLAHGKIRLKGVVIPVVPEIYKPVLSELERLDIRMVEKQLPAD
jgi:saccharopine dehydrogenase (NADP+, L-glutamate forming)